MQAVASIYDDFQEHISIPKLAKALYELANTHPYQAEGLTPRIQNSNQLQGGEGDEEEVRILMISAQMIDQTAFLFLFLFLFLPT
jgi:hypothetical protein